jgi:FkbH-like protein
MKSFSQLKRNLKNDFSRLEPVRVALLGDSSTQFLAQALRATGYDRSFDVKIWEADFNQIERQVFDQTAELYQFKPQVIILFHSTHELLGEYNKLDADHYIGLAASRLDLIDRLYQAIRTRLAAKVIYYNYPEINDAVFGNYSNKTESSFLFQLRKLNYEIMRYAGRRGDFYVYDLGSLQNQLGKGRLFSPSIYVNTGMVLAVDALPNVAEGTMDLIGAFSGRQKKCVILDLDDMIWGGVVGDDGMENIEIGSLGIGKAFTEFQYWLKKLKNRGIILAVCSKNTESVAKEPFERHPDMILGLDDIAVFIANWENKVDNIRRIQAILNIGFDSMVFLDDNPFERNMVREGIPAVTVPELPEDPADYLEFLYSLNLFETAVISGEDGERTKLYQTEAGRSAERQDYNNEDAFLSGLNMISRVRSFDPLNVPRVAQLSQRSNQWNLRTVRYSEAELMKTAGSPDSFTFSFSLEDKFGDNGIIGVIILKSEPERILFIDSWLMSCRVLNRGMENFMLNTIVAFAMERGYRKLKGEYLPTLKNEIVRDHYRNLSFLPENECWILDLVSYEQKKTHVKNG